MRTARLAALAAALLMTASVLPALGEGTGDLSARYEEAEALLEEGRYDEACSAFSQIAGYEDASQKAYALSVALRMDCEPLTDTALLCSYGGKVGLVELSSGTVLSPRWDEARLLDDDTLATRDADGWAVRGITGEPLSGERWDALALLDDGVLLVSRGGLYGLADMTGRALTELCWTGAAGKDDGTLPEEIGLPACGLFSARDAEGLWGYADTTGAWAVEPKYASAGGFDAQGRAVARLADGSYSVIGAKDDTSIAEGAEAWNAEKQASYAEAEALLAAGDYGGAIGLFNELVPYADTESRVKECCYRMGLSLLEKGRTDEALDAFDQAEDWPGAKEQVDQIAYERARALEDAGDVSGALDLYLQLGSYEDSSARADALEARLVGLDIVYMGRYEQDGDESDGREPIQWYVLRRGKTGVTLISRYCLDCQVYRDEYKSTSWEKCDLRAWLNDTFLKAAFTSKERKAILERKVKNDAEQNDPNGQTDGGDDTQDRVYLLSYHEAKTALEQSAVRRARPTAYAVSRGVETFGGWCRWWTRSPGSHSYNVTIVDEDGALGSYAEPMIDTLGVRPVITVDIDQFDKIVSTVAPSNGGDEAPEEELPEEEPADGEDGGEPSSDEAADEEISGEDLAVEEDGDADDVIVFPDEG